MRFSEGRRRRGQIFGGRGKDGHDAVRILVPRIRQAAAPFPGDPFIAAVPNRDFLILWSSTNRSAYRRRGRLFRLNVT